MKRNIILMPLIILSILFIGFLLYSKFVYPPIPSITKVGLVDNKIEVQFDIDKNNINNDVYCIITKNIFPDANDNNWSLSKNNKCLFNIDKDSYTVYLKNKNNEIIEVSETSKLGKVINIETNKNKVYLPINGIYHPTLTIDTIGYIGENVKWISNNPDVVSVDNDGTIKALKKGNSIIKATLKDKDVSIEVISTNLITLKPNKFNNNKKYLTCGNYTKEDNDLLDEILKDRLNDVGFKTRASTVEAARFITLEFPYKIRYFSENGRLTYASKIDGEGRYYHEGLYLHSSRFKSLAKSNQGPKTWGCKMYSKPSHGIRRNGFDCSGFISWVLLNGGFDVGDLGAGVSAGVKDLTDVGKKTRFTSSLIKNGKVKVGDLLSSKGPSGGHIAIIVGEDDNNYYVAESLWYEPYIGVVIVGYSKKTIYNRYYWIMLMDSVYKEDGKLTKMWY